MGFATEILFMLMLGLLILGPKRLHAMLGHVARAKAELENATRGIKSQLAAQLDVTPQQSQTDCSHESGASEPSSESSASEQRTRRLGSLKSNAFIRRAIRASVFGRFS